MFRISIYKEMVMNKVKMFKNMRQRTIPKKLRILRSANSEILSKFQGTGNVSDRPRCGHPWKLLYTVVQKLISTVKTQPKKTTKLVMDECDLSNLVSVDTSEWILQEHKMKRCIAA